MRCGDLKMDLLERTDFPVILDNCALDPELAFENSDKSEFNFGGERGFFVGAQFSNDEIISIRSEIKSHLVGRAFTISRDYANLIDANELSHYHSYCDPELHPKMFSKMGRILPDESVKKISKFSVFDYLSDCFGDFELSDEEGLGYQQISFRIVRPNNRADVGDPHRDVWFWESLRIPNIENKKRAKLWFMIDGDPSVSGLILAPGSHRIDIPYALNNVGGRNRFDSDIAQQVPYQRFAGPIGQTVMFNYGCLHAGTVNYGDQCRISCEMTIMF